MLKESITYTDYNGITRTEDFYFNLNETEVVEFVSSKEGDFEEQMNKIVASKDGEQIMKAFKDLVARSYGEKSPDGKRFMKSPEISRAFFETEAYNQFFLRLVTDPDYAANWLTGVLPKKPETN